MLSRHRHEGLVDVAGTTCLHGLKPYPARRRLRRSQLECVPGIGRIPPSSGLEFAGSGGVDIGPRSNSRSGVQGTLFAYLVSGIKRGDGTTSGITSAGD